MSAARDPVYLAAFAASLILTALLLHREPGIFQWLLGPLPALAVVVAAGLAGWLALSLTGGGDTRVPWRHIVPVAALFVVPPVLIDLFLPFPRDINVPLPQALAFYPVAGFVAEALFHLVPLAVMVVLLRRRDLPVWAFTPAAFAEPLFQAAMSGGMTLQGMLVAFHVLAFSSVQLWMFRRYGYAAMLALRLVFYLGWHLIWGVLRLSLMFPA